MMKKYRITYDRSKCIGATACTDLLPEHFKMDKEDKAELLKSKKDGDIYTLEISEDLKHKAEKAVQACPTLAITLEEIKE